jgi:small subunit ribosomal protein S5
MSEVQNETNNATQTNVATVTTPNKRVFTRTEKTALPSRRTGGMGSSSPRTEGGPQGPRSEGGRRSFGGNSRNSSGPSRPGGRDGGMNRRRNSKPEGDVQELEAKVIEVRRVTRVVKGGKRMRFSALVVVGDREGKVGYGLKKGLDFQDAVAKATKSANQSLIKVNLDEHKSLSFVTDTKYKSCNIFLKTAASGTGLIAGGFIRPVLELAGVENIYSKINRSRNKIVGVQTVIKALERYSKITTNK